MDQGSSNTGLGQSNSADSMPLIEFRFHQGHPGPMRYLPDSVKHSEPATTKAN
jgi:hypothetical protein